MGEGGTKVALACISAHVYVYMSMSIVKPTDAHIFLDLGYEIPSHLSTISYGSTLNSALVQAYTHNLCMLFPISDCAAFPAREGTVSDSQTHMTIETYIDP